MVSTTSGYQAAFFKTLDRFSKGDVSRVMERYISRFPIARKAYSLLKASQQMIGYQSPLKEKNKTEVSLLEHSSTTQEYLSILRQDSVAFGINLPESIVNEIYDFACSAPCIAYGPAATLGSFRYSEIDNGILRNHYPVALAEVQELSACSAIEKLASDPLLLEVVRGYLGYYPTRIDRYMSWTTKIDLAPDQVAKLNQPVVYHYDLAGYNTVRAYFYITDIDEDSGPHVMIKGSHNRKPLKMTFSPCQQTEEALYEYYGKDKEIVIVGKKGLGFFQDPFCFHRASTPKKQDRLLFQLRYF